MITIADLKNSKGHNIVQDSPIVQNRSELRKLKINAVKQLYRVAVKKTANPTLAMKIGSQLINNIRSVTGVSLMPKVAKVDNRYYWGLTSPGFPSLASMKMNENEVDRLIPGLKNVGLRNLVFAITKKCPLNCEHCSEWENLNKKKDLPTSEIIDIIHKYQDYGTTQIMLSGGEPMLRVNDLYEILKASKKGTDFWIITSGLGLNEARARRLKESGLTGVMVSLDHFDADKHNEFRGIDGAFEWAINAIEKANNAGLITALSLCATKAFTTNENLKSYMDLAKEVGVSFVQILEPIAKGRYAGKDVALGKKEMDVLDKVYLDYNRLRSLKEYPIINYMGFQQRQVGCFGGGNRFFYIDTDGDVHLCPFCDNKVGNAMHFSAEDMIQLLGAFDCFDFEKSAF